MTTRLLFLTLALATVIAAAPATAQTAMDYYHEAARAYIGDARAEAERAALAGLALDPVHARLQALLEKIREQPPENGDGQPDSSDDADSSDPPEDSDEADSADTGDDGTPQPSDQAADQQPGDGQQQEGAPPETPQPAEPDEGEGPAGEGKDPAEIDLPPDLDVKPGAMSRAEAERLLRAVEADELDLLREVQRRRARPRYVEKDW